MVFNREKIAFLVAVLLCVAGLLAVGASLVSPSQEVRLPDVQIARVESKPFLPELRMFRQRGGGDGAIRNPFRLSEGWQRLDALPLRPPSLPYRQRLVPTLSGGVSPLAGGFLSQERSPIEVDPLAPTTGTGGGN